MRGDDIPERKNAFVDAPSAEAARRSRRLVGCSIAVIVAVGHGRHVYRTRQERRSSRLGEGREVLLQVLGALGIGDDKQVRHSVWSIVTTATTPSLSTSGCVVMPGTRPGQPTRPSARRIPVPIGAPDSLCHVTSLSLGGEAMTER
jgi:hypothetical protein